MTFGLKSQNEYEIMNDGKQTIQQAHRYKYTWDEGWHLTCMDKWPKKTQQKTESVNMKKRHQEKKSDTSTCWNKWFIVCDEARRDEKLVYGHIHHIQHSHIISVTLNNSSDESQHNYLEAAGGKELTPVTWLSLSLEFRQSQTSAVKLGFGELKLVFFVFLNQLLLYSNADVTVQILKTAQLQLLQKHIKAKFFFPQPQNRNHILLL